MSNYETLLVENRRGLRIFKFNSPKTKNAFRAESYMELQDAFKKAAADDSVKLVALTGEGDFYSSGNDIKALSNRGGSNMDEILDESKIMLTNFVRSFYTFPKPLIAVVNGPCIGIAATTAALCDVVYASSTAYFYTPFTLMGLCAEGCSSYTFPKILGKSKASEMLLFSHKMLAKEALQFGFVSEIFEPNEIEVKIWSKIEKFGDLSSGSMVACRNLVKHFDKDILEQVNINENEELQRRWQSGDPMEAVVNFMMRKKSKL